MENRVEILPGIYLRTVQTQKFKTGCFSINFLRPLHRQTASEYALIPSVLLRGSQSHPDMQSISQFLDELYGASMGTLVRKKGEIQSVGFFLDFIEDDFTFPGDQVLAPMVAFLGEILSQPVLEQGAFRESYVTGEKVNLINTIEAQINDKRSFAMSQMLKLMCQDEAYGTPRLGDVETAEKISARVLYSQYEKMLSQSQVEIFYMGRASQETVKQLLTEALAPMPRRVLDAVGTQVVTKADRVREVTEHMEVSQGKLTLGFRTGCTASDPAYPALMVLNSIYGSGVTSKLFLQVREALSLCYYASSSLEKFKGVMAVSSGIASENYAVAKEAILQQLKACQQGEITEEELGSAKQQIVSSLKMGMDSPGRLDDFYLGQTILGQPSTMEDLARQVSAVTKDQVVSAAQNLSLDTVYFLEGVGV